MSTSTETSGLRAALILTIVILAGWAACFWPARWLGGTAGVGWMTLAAASCLVPGWFVVILSRLAIFRNDLTALVCQTFLRIGCVAIVAIVVRQLRPDLGLKGFFGWLIGFYLLALMVEARVARRPKTRADQQQSHQLKPSALNGSTNTVKAD